MTIDVHALEHRVIRASAGTGKTFALSTRYIKLLSAGADPREILATTFTRKAAGEILERILRRLADATASELEAATLAAEIREPELDVQRARALLKRLAVNLHRVAVGTLDSFFHGIAGTLRSELELPAEAALMGAESPGIQVAMAEAIRTLLQRHDRAELAPLLRDLGRGSPTGAVAGRLIGILAKHYDLYHESAASAWGPMHAEQPLDGDWPAALSRLEELQGQLHAKSRDKWATWIADLREGNWIQASSHDILAKVEEAETFSGASLTPEVKDAVRMAGRRIAGRVRAIYAAEMRAMHALLSLLDAVYTEARRAKRTLLYSDVPFALGRLLAGQDEASSFSRDRLYWRLDGHYRHLLLDEFQDTARGQWEILRPIAQEIASHAIGAHAEQTFFCVGDEKQAIYGWRGGCAAIFGHLEDELPLNKDAFQPLDRSYRSSKVILDTVNTIFEGLGANAALQKPIVAEEARDWADRFRTHETAYPKQPGFVRLVSAPTDADDESGGDGEAGDSSSSDDASSLRLAGPVRAAAALAESVLKEAPGRSIGILFRSNGPIGGLVAHFRRKAIPVSGEGGQPMTDDPAVTAILAALDLAQHPGDTIACAELARTALGAHLGLEPGAGPGGRQLVGTRIRAVLADQGPARVIAEWARIVAVDADARGAARLGQAVRLAASVAEVLTPGELAAHVRAALVEDPSAARLRVMTIHAAKGLEFDVVILPELHKPIGYVHNDALCTSRPSPTAAPDGIFPAGNKEIRALVPEMAAAYDRETRRIVQDDLCTFYVALTRARYALHLIIPALKKNKDGSPAARHFTTPCFSALLRQALSGVKERESEKGGECLYEAGDPAWHVKAKPVEPEPPPAVDVVLKFDRAVGAPRRGWQTVSPSSLEGSGRVAASVLLDLERAPGRQRGSLIHAWFALVGDTADPPSADTLGTAAMQAEPGAPARLVSGLQAEFLRLLEERVVREELSGPKLSSGEECETWIERPFALRVDGGKLLQGRFDRAFVVRRNSKPVRAVILDFKTDEVRDESGLAARIAEYSPQMHAYREAAAGILKLPLESVSARLLFLSGRPQAVRMD